MDFKAKFNLSEEENIFVAKRNIVDYIWKSARLEGIAVTFPETEAIYNGMGVANVPIKNILAVNNLKHAWQFIFETMDCPTDYAYICELNRIVGNGDLIFDAGFLRKIPVSIGGTSWKPDLPDELNIKDKLSEICTIDNPTERSILLMLYCMRTQMFVDGNKRTSMLAANHEMIMNGCGIISVPIEHQPEFTKLLVEFYETNDADTLAQFVYDNCIDGLDLRTQEKYAKQAAEKEKFNVNEKLSLEERTQQYKKQHSSTQAHQETDNFNDKPSAIAQIEEIKAQKTAEEPTNKSININKSSDIDIDE